MTYKLDRNFDTDTCRLLYNSMSDVIKGILGRSTDRLNNITVVAMSDTSKPYSYTLLKSRTIVLNTAKRVFDMYGELAQYVQLRDNVYHNNLIITTMIDDVAHELHHLLVPTDPSRYSNDKSYAMVIEHTVKLNTLRFLTDNYAEISRTLGLDYDINMLNIIFKQYADANVVPVIGYPIIRPF